jgi:hypothetical protein
MRTACARRERSAAQRKPRASRASAWNARSCTAVRSAAPAPLLAAVCASAVCAPRQGSHQSSRQLHGNMIHGKSASNIWEPARIGPCSRAPQVMHDSMQLFWIRNTPSAVAANCTDALPALTCSSIG